MNNKYNKNYLLPKITNEVTLKYNNNNPRTSLWQTLYLENPENYWCNVFTKKMSESSKEDIMFMVKAGAELEEELAKIINSDVDPYGEEAKKILFLLIKHLEFFHKMDQHFYDTLIELCERAESFGKEMPWLDELILKNPNFLRQNPLVGMLSKRYNGIILNILIANKNAILKGEYSVLR